MRLDTYQRGFLKGTEHMAYTLAVHKDGELRIGVMATLLRDFVKELRELAAQGQTTLGAPIPNDDPGEWTADELRQERDRIVELLEAADYFEARREQRTGEASRDAALARVPEHLREGLLRYLDDHIVPGDFMVAVLCNDLKDAMARADAKSRAGLYDLVFYLYNHAPVGAWGDRKAVERYCTPSIPLLSPATLGEELAVSSEGTVNCPGCGGRHPLRWTRAQVCIPPQASTKIEHEVQYVWCGSRTIPLGIDGKELP